MLMRDDDEQVFVTSSPRRKQLLPTGTKKSAFLVSPSLTSPDVLSLNSPSHHGKKCLSLLITHASDVRYQNNDHRDPHHHEASCASKQSKKCNCSNKKSSSVLEQIRASSVGFRSVSESLVTLLQYNNSENYSYSFPLSILSSSLMKNRKVAVHLTHLWKAIA